MWDFGAFSQKNPSQLKKFSREVGVITPKTPLRWISQSTPTPILGGIQMVYHTLRVWGRGKCKIDRETQPFLYTCLLIDEAIIYFDSSIKLAQILRSHHRVIELCVISNKAYFFLWKICDKL